MDGLMRSINGETWRCVGMGCITEDRTLSGGIGEPQEGCEQGRGRGGSGSCEGHNESTS